MAIRIFNFRPQIKDAEDVFNEYGHFFVFLVSITHDQGQGKIGSQNYVNGYGDLKFPGSSSHNCSYSMVVMCF